MIYSGREKNLIKGKSPHDIYLSIMGRPSSVLGPKKTAKKTSSPLSQKVENKTTHIPDDQWMRNNLPIPQREYKFLDDRRYRIDFCYPYVKLAIEIEGGVWSNGRHTRGAGFIGDMEKYNLLVENGWWLLRYMPGKVDFSQIRKVYNSLKETRKCIVE